jgi:transposase
MVPPEQPKPVRVFAQDESRWSLRTIQRRRITAKGTKPEGTTVFRTETTWLFGAIDPTCGEGFWLILPRLNAAAMQVFLDEFAAYHADTFNILILDNSPAHTASTLRIPANVALVFQPPHCPEVNPVERFWQDIKARLAWQTLAHIELLEDGILARVAQYPAAALQSLTAYPFLIAAIDYLLARTT